MATCKRLFIPPDKALDLVLRSFCSPTNVVILSISADSRDAGNPFILNFTRKLKNHLKYKLS